MSIALSPRRRLAGGTVIVAVLAVLAVGSFVVFDIRRDNGPARTTAGPPATAPPANPTVPAPQLKTTGEDWDQIVRSIVAYRHWLYAHNPDPELIAKIEVPSYNFFADDQLGLRNLATKGWRYDPPRQPVNVELVRFRFRDAENVASVFVRFGPTPANRVVDGAGDIVLESPETPANAVVWTLVREPASDPHWRLFKVTPFTDRPAPA